MGSGICREAGLSYLLKSGVVVVDIGKEKVEVVVGLEQERVVALGDKAEMDVTELG